MSSGKTVSMEAGLQRTLATASLYDKNATKEMNKVIPMNIHLSTQSVPDLTHPLGCVLNRQVERPAFISGVSCGRDFPLQMSQFQMMSTSWAHPGKSSTAPMGLLSERLEGMEREQNFLRDRANAVARDTELKLGKLEASIAQHFIMAPECPNTGMSPLLQSLLLGALGDLKKGLEARLGQLEAQMDQALRGVAELRTAVSTMDERSGSSALEMHARLEGLDRQAREFQSNLGSETRRLEQLQQDSSVQQAERHTALLQRIAGVEGAMDQDRRAAVASRSALEQRLGAAEESAASMSRDFSAFRSSAEPQLASLGSTAGRLSELEASLQQARQELGGQLQSAGGQLVALAQQMEEARAEAQRRTSAAASALQEQLLALGDKADTTESRVEALVARAGAAEGRLDTLESGAGLVRPSAAASVPARGGVSSRSVSAMEPPQSARPSLERPLGPPPLAPSASASSRRTSEVLASPAATRPIQRRSLSGTTGVSLSPKPEDIPTAAGAQEAGEPTATTAVSPPADVEPQVGRTAPPVAADRSASATSAHPDTTAVAKAELRTEAPAVESHVAEAPAAESHVAEAPAAESHVAEAPAVESHVAEAPAVESHVAEAPAAESHVAEAPAAESRSVEAAAVVESHAAEDKRSELEHTAAVRQARETDPLPDASIAATGPPPVPSRLPSEMGDPWGRMSGGSLPSRASEPGAEVRRPPFLLCPLWSAARPAPDPLPLPSPPRKAAAAGPADSDRLYDPESGWEQVLAPHPDDPSATVVYYYNHNTGVSTYDRPSEVEHLFG